MTPSHGEGKQGHGLSLPCLVLEGKDGRGWSDPLSLLLDKVCGHTHPGHATAPPSGEAENCWALFRGQTLAEGHCWVQGSAPRLHAFRH